MTLTTRHRGVSQALRSPGLTIAFAIAAVALVSVSVSSATGAASQISKSYTSTVGLTPLDSSSATWSKLTGLSPHPSARYGAVMAYDPAIQKVVLFGGSGPGGVLLNDTWTFSAGTWTRLSTPVAPAPRVAATMVWDAADHDLLLFGGVTDQSSAQGCSAPMSIGVFCGDTWSFDHGKWTLLHPTSSPPARWYAVMAYDPALDEVVLGGGASGFGNLSDMWTFQAGTWTQVTLPPPNTAGNPFNGRYSSMAFDPHDHYLVFFGPGRFPSAQTWNYTGGNWTKLSTTRAPPAVASGSLAFDPHLGRLILFGGSPFGFPGEGALSDTWEFHAGVWTNVTHGAHPSSRSDAVTAYDAADGYLLLFGGETGSGALLGDTWILQ
jgi:Galactose oxidase, central domain